jgi:replicative DNA helicase
MQYDSQESKLQDKRTISSEEKNFDISNIHQFDQSKLINSEAEFVLLGTIISNPSSIEKVLETLQPKYFSDLANQQIYQQILQQFDKTGVSANSITLKNFFDHNPATKEKGGVSYLNFLVSRAVIIVDLRQYVKVIYDLFLKRQLSNIGEEIVIEAYNPKDFNRSGEEQIELAEKKLFLLSDQNSQKNDFINIATSLKKTLSQTLLAKNRASSISGVSTGLIDMDRILGGMQKSDLIILAGRPSMGKTALAINIAVNACKIMHQEDLQKNEELENSDNNFLNAKKSHAVAFFSLEMSSEQLSARILSMETSINATKFRNGNINEIEWEVIATRSGEISQLPFFIDDTPALSINAIRTRTRRLMRKSQLSLIVIDYLQLIKGSGGRGSENRVQEISEITQGLKAIAKEFNIPVVALSQLSRAVEQRDDKRPQLSDLRESGSIEQDADVVAFIYRESYYHERLRPADNDHKFPEWQQKMQDLRHVSEVIIAKQRNGPIDTAKLFFDAEFTRFNNLDTDHF